MRFARTCFAILCCIVLVAACEATTPPKIYIPPAFDIIKISQKKQLSVLFVLDNSPSMAPHMPHIRERFSEALQHHAKDKFIDLTAALITTDMNDPAHSGKFQRYFRSKGMGRRDLKEEIDKFFDIPATGSTHEQGLKAVTTALSDKMLQGPHRGFLRPESTLFVFFISDEDDCSTTQAQSTPPAGQDPVCRPSQEASLIPHQTYLQWLTSFMQKHKKWSALLTMHFTGIHRNSESFMQCQSDQDCTKFPGTSCVSNVEGQGTFCGGCRQQNRQVQIGYRYMKFNPTAAERITDKDTTFTRYSHAFYFSLCDIDHSSHPRGAIGQLLTGPCGLYSCYALELSRKVTDESEVTVKLKTPKGREYIVPAAPKTKEDCASYCNTRSREGRNCHIGLCYGDGYILLTLPNPSVPQKIKLNGAYVELADPGSTIEVHYNKPWWMDKK